MREVRNLLSEGFRFQGLGWGQADFRGSAVFIVSLFLYFLLLLVLINRLL